MVVGRIYDFFHVVCEVCIAPYLYDDAVWKKKFEIYKIEFTFTDPSVWDVIVLGKEENIVPMSRTKR
jgi:hypothetical protein